MTNELGVNVTVTGGWLLLPSSLPLPPPAAVSATESDAAAAAAASRGRREATAAAVHSRGVCCEGAWRVGGAEGLEGSDIYRALVNGRESRRVCMWSVLPE